MLEERMSDVRERVRTEAWDTCIVVNAQRVVLGRLSRRALASDTDESVEEAMSPGPSTVRPSIGTDALLERIRARKLTGILVTTPDGRLVGLARRIDLE
jgi:Mg/Co/Ni transporter MgtE